MFDSLSFTFAQPLWFLLLLAMPLWWWWRAKKQHQINPTFAVTTLTTKNTLANSWQQKAIKKLPILQWLALALCIVALARPQKISIAESNNGNGIDIVLSIDISGSMLAKDFEPNRLEAAKKVATTFIENRPYDKIGLVMFSGESFTACPLTTDHNTLINQVANLQSGTLTFGTAIGMGLATAVERLKASSAKSKVIVLLTDGVNNMGLIDPSSALEIAKAFGIKVYTIGVGTMGTALTPTAQNAFGEWVFTEEKVEIDEALLQKIATETNGKYYRATNNESLSNIYSNIDKLEKSEIKLQNNIKRKELFIPWIMAACILLLLHFIAKYYFLKSVLW